MLSKNSYFCSFHARIVTIHICFGRNHLQSPLGMLMPSAYNLGQKQSPGTLQKLKIEKTSIWPASREKGLSDITNSVDQDQPLYDIENSYT